MQVDECKINICSCTNGGPVIGPVSNDGQLSDNHDEAKCLNFVDGYPLDNFECPVNVCQCNDGVGAVGPVSVDGKLCDANNSFKCISCDTGYHLEGDE